MIATVAPVSHTTAVSQKAAKAEGIILPRLTTEPVSYTHLTLPTSVTV